MTTKKPYISCIRINGVPILPPLITSKLRNEIQEYKQKAIDIENKLKRNKIFKHYIDEIEKLQEFVAIDPSSLESSRRSPDLHSSLSTVVEANLQHPKIVKTLENQLTFTPRSDTTNEVPKFNNKINLTRETIDVSEYTNEGVKLITESDCTNSELEKSVSINLSGESKDSDLKRSNSYTLLEPSSAMSSQLQDEPRLVRSSSYTLDAPSPLLLAHLQREKEVSFERVPRRSSLDNSSIPVVQINTPTKNYVMETDITVQRITIKTPMDEGEKLEKTIDPQLLEILKKLPIDCSKQIIEILEKQKLGQQQNENFIDFNPVDKETSTPVINHNTPTNESMYYTVVDSFNDSELKKKRRSLSPRKLFLGRNQRDLKTKEQAASIICAAVRGYLTRRLLKTERVQVLIRTIKDVVLCALQLSKSDNFDEYDAELHRRLIHQLDAALFAFHDIFFTLPIREQMSIIALDRQRLFNRAQKNISRTSSARSDSSIKGRSRTNSKSSRV